MKKAAIISLTIVALIAFTSCGGSRTACNGYHGVTSAKVNKQRQKEFKKPKHKIKKSKAHKRGN